jgi:penicillin-binding protein 1C
VRRALAAVLLASVAAASHAMPGFDAVRAAHRPSDLPLFDRHGELLAAVRVDKQVRRGPWLALADVSPALREALLLSEDRRFWQHSGVDWKALAASAWSNAWSERTRGASTLTMQLAALLDDELARPAGGRSVAAKLTQMQRAARLEARWSKAQILEAYLNLVPLRGELVGLAAAADQLFGKHTSGLDAQESALLAAMVRAPNAAPAVVERRACEVLRQTLGHCAGLATTLAQALARGSAPWRVLGGEGLAPHLAGHAARALQDTGATTVPRSTLDARVQRLALAALRRQMAELRGREVEDGAVIVLDNASGEVLAWVGSAGRASAGVGPAAGVDGVLARRQPGSTIKPFVYALAFEQRLLTAASVLDDSPIALAAGSGLYAPRNYDQRHRGALSAREALAGSVNVPAVQVAAMTGVEPLFERLQALGLQLAESAGFHGHALALGSAEVNLLALTNAYRALANGGMASAPRWRADVPAAAARPVFTAASAWLVGHVLADPTARAASFGLDSPLVTRGFAAVKTGTSKDMRDNWCIGFTSRYTVGVWVGNASGAPMHGVSGVSGAAPVWRELVEHLHAGAPSKLPPPPAGVARIEGEWYLAGTGPAPGREAARAFGITSPREGSVIALDPEIPITAQRLVFSGAAGQWLLNGRPIGQGARVSWLPQPGRHTLERRDGEAVDRVRFEVRAAPPRPATARRG